jgi:hypothetical protein
MLCYIVFRTVERSSEPSWKLPLCTRGDHATGDFCPEGATGLSPGFQPWELSPQAIRPERARDDYMINAGKRMFSPCSVWRPFRGCRTCHILVLTVFTVPLFASERRRRQTEDSSSESKLVPALGEIGCEGLTNSPLLRAFGLLLG